VGDLFKAISGSLARFVFAWDDAQRRHPRLFWIFALPEVDHIWPFRQIALPGKNQDITAA
jgi:hypothetical protein